MNEVVLPSGELDVRVLVPTERHKLLLRLFKELPARDFFVFINDHDPIPLFYEFRSRYGEVVGWEYMNRGGRNWKVKVTKLEETKEIDFSGVSTMIDLRQVEAKNWKHVIFHRYGMMQAGEVMEMIAPEKPVEIQDIFANKFAGQYDWTALKETEGQYVIHLTKKTESGLGDEGFMVVNEFDIRPYPPTQRHEMFYEAFAAIAPGEAFVFINDHDPRPLYYQMEAESNEPFKWEYLEQGPEVWKVRVRKTRTL